MVGEGDGEGEGERENEGESEGESFLEDGDGGTYDTDIAEGNDSGPVFPIAETADSPRRAEG